MDAIQDTNVSDEQAIRQLVSSWLAASKQEDTQRVLGLMTDDAVFLAPRQPPIRGKAAFAASQAALQSFAMDAVSEIQEIRVLGDWAWLWTRLTVVLTPKRGGAHIRRTGHTMSILRKQGGRWLLARDANMLAEAPRENPNETPATYGRIAGPAGSLHVDDGGEGQATPVLFVHAFAGSAAHWAAQLAHLRKTRRAIAFDLRGHGRSGAPRDDDYAIGALAADIAAVADHLELKRLVLVGHSLGAAAAIAYADAHPDRVAGLVAFGAPAKVPTEQANQIMLAMGADYDAVTREYWEKLLQGARPQARTEVTSEMNSISRRSTLRIIRATLNDDPLPALRRFSSPVLIIHTSHGNQPHDLQNALPNLPHVEIAGTSHWAQMDDPQEFNRVLDEFLAGVK